METRLIIKPKKPGPLRRLFVVSKIVVRSVGESIDTYKYKKDHNLCDTAQPVLGNNIKLKKQSEIVQDAVSNILNTVTNTEYKSKRYEYLQATGKFKPNRKMYSAPQRMGTAIDVTSAHENDNIESSNDEQQQDQINEMPHYEEPPRYEDIC